MEERLCERKKICCTSKRWGNNLMQEEWQKEITEGVLEAGIK
jgi:hypothetical protein